MVYGATLRSKYARAKILSVDCRKVLEIPGIIKIFAAKDIPGHNSHGVLCPDAPVYAEASVNSVNDAILTVIAKTQAAAQEALEVVRIEYEELPGVYDPREAMQATAPKLRPEGNIAYHGKIRHGDVAEGFRKAHVIIEENFSTSMVDTAFLQPEACVAAIDDRGHIVLYVATQYPHWDRTEIAKVLNLPQNRVRVITTAVGGAFGGREDMTLQGHACLAAMVLKRPVKIIYDRRASFQAHSKRHPHLYEI